MGANCTNAVRRRPHTDRDILHRVTGRALARAHTQTHTRTRTHRCTETVTVRAGYSGPVGLKTLAGNLCAFRRLLAATQVLIIGGAVSRGTSARLVLNTDGNVWERDANRVGSVEADARTPLREMQRLRGRGPGGMARHGGVGRVRIPPCRALSKVAVRIGLVLSLPRQWGSAPLCPALPRRPDDPLPHLAARGRWPFSVAVFLMSQGKGHSLPL